MENGNISTEMTHKTRPNRKSIIKNLCVISLAFVFLFTSYDGLSMLQSTINSKDGGTISQSTVYVAFAISALVLPKYVIRKIGCKMALFSAVIVHIPYLMANFYPGWFTLIPTAVLVGIGASILWGSQGTYFNESSVLYCMLEDEEKRREQEADVIKEEEPKHVKEPISNQKSYKIIAVPNNPSLDPDKVSVIATLENLEFRNGGRRNVIEMIRRKSSQDILEELSIKSIMGQFSHNNSRKSSMGDSLTSRNTFANDVASENVRNRRKSSVFKKNMRANERRLSVLCEENKHAAYDFKCNHLGNQKRESLNYQLSVKYSVNPEDLARNSRIENVTALFFGCHGFAYYAAMLFSNLMSYYVLLDNSAENGTDPSRSCGADFCNVEVDLLESDTHKVPDELRYLLSGLCVAFAILAAILLLFALDPLEEELEPVKISLDHLTATLKQCKKKEQIFLLPLSVFVGMMQGFSTADLTKSYADCAWGTAHVGLVCVFYGLAGSLSSTVSGYLVKYMGRVPIFAAGYILALGNFAFLLLWRPDTQQIYLFLLAGALCGAVVALFFSQLQAFHGVLFKKDEEAAFASYYLFNSIGWTLAFSYSDFICTSTKIYILVVVASLGIVGYFITERLFRVRKIRTASTMTIISAS